MLPTIRGRIVQWLSRASACLPRGAETERRAAEMLLHLERADIVYRPSHFWTDFARWNVAMLREGGIANFKRSIPQNYFNWMVDTPTHPQMVALLQAWAQQSDHLSPPTELRGSPAAAGVGGRRFLESPESAQAYVQFVGLLWWLARRNDDGGHADLLEEPAAGNPIPIFIDGRRVSQDLANSLREYQRLRPSLSPSPAEPRPILGEIGAGYGRLGYVAMRCQPLRYWIFDIPPALAIAEWYLPRVLSSTRVFRWRRFSSWQDVAEEAGAADLAFFTIDQLPMVPAGTIRSFAAISALHEMRHDQIASYVADIARVTTGAFYAKNWTRWHNAADGVDFTADLSDPPGDWRATFRRVDDVLADFTEVLYQRQPVHPSGKA